MRVLYVRDNACARNCSCRKFKNQITTSLEICFFHYCLYERLEISFFPLPKASAASDTLMASRWWLFSLLPLLPPPPPKISHLPTPLPQLLIFLHPFVPPSGYARAGSWGGTSYSIDARTFSLYFSAFTKTRSAFQERAQHTYTKSPQ